MLKKFLKHIGKYKWFAILAPMAMVFEVMFQIRIPFYMSKIVDIGIANSDMTSVWHYGGLMIAVAIASMICGVVGSLASAKAGIGFGTELRKSAFDKIQNFSFSNIDKFSDASLITRLTSDITNVQQAFIMSIRIGFRAPVMFIGAMAMAITINPEMSKLFLYVLPILLIIMLIFAKVAYPRFSLMMKKYDAINSNIQENLVGIRVVKSFVREKFERNKFADTSDELNKAGINAMKLISYAQPLMMLMIYGCIVSVLWIGGNMVISETMLTGELISFITYVTQVLFAMLMLMAIFINLIMSKASINRIYEILDEEPDISDIDAEKEAIVEDGSIEFKNVCFKYDKSAEHNVLENINISIKSGETIGILGATGSAKSTLVQLIPRFYDATCGEILVGGKNVKNYTTENLRDAVSMVLQKNLLFSGTIKDNLRWGDNEASDEEIILACKNAAADGFVQTFTDGYETDLGQGGVNVSGGQKQRLCIARALLKKPKILIMDDSTSAVDTATNSKIIKALSENLKNTTVLTIAQRVSAIENSDRIMILEEGKIIDFDTPANLYKNNDTYKDIYDTQMKVVE